MPSRRLDLTHNVLRLMIAAALVVPARTASAEDDPGDAAVLAHLDDPAYLVREAETDALLADDRLTEQRLLALARASRTPEQRHRLLAVARHHTIRRAILAEFDDEDRGSLGISHHAVVRETPDGRQTGAIQVILTLPGFPAHGRLRPEDMILAIDRQALPADPTGNRFVAALQSRPSGQSIVLTVLRNGREIQVPITLAPSTALSTVYNTQDTELTFRFATIWQGTRKRMEQAYEQADEAEQSAASG